MLYLTTRDASDAHTAYKTLVSDCAADGGLYIPFRMPQFDATEVNRLVNCSFGEIVAEILNSFFSAQLTGWDVDFSIGRASTKIVCLSRKILLAQCWHNPESKYAYIEKSLFEKLCKVEGTAAYPTDWVKVAVRIAVLFGIYGELIKTKILSVTDQLDIAADSNDFSQLFAAWYAKKMGLPLNMIICCSDENGALWDFVHRGELNTTQLSDALRLGLERLFFDAYGCQENLRFVGAHEKRSLYTLEDGMPLLSDTLFCAVIGKNRVGDVVNSVYRTDNYLLDPQSAPSYGAIQDYRSKTGENRPTLLITEQDPVLTAKAIAEATGLTADEIFTLRKKL